MCSKIADSGIFHAEPTWIESEYMYSKYDKHKRICHKCWRRRRRRRGSSVFRHLCKFISKWKADWFLSETNHLHKDHAYDVPWRALCMYSFRLCTSYQMMKMLNGHIKFKCHPACLHTATGFNSSVGNVNWTINHKFTTFSSLSVTLSPILCHDDQLNCPTKNKLAQTFGV